MKNSVVPILLALGLGSPLAVRGEDSYQFEAELAYDSHKWDSTKIEITGAGLNYYFTPLPLQPGDHPLDETAFVARATGVSLVLGRVTYDVSGFQRTSAGSTAGVELTYRQPDSPLYLRAHYLEIDYGKQSASVVPWSPTEVEIDQVAYEVAAGGYVARTSLLALELGQEILKVRDNVFGSDPDEKLRHIGIFGRHLAQLEGGGYVALEARFQRLELDVPDSSSPSGSRSYLEATFYPKRSFGLTAAFSRQTGDAARVNASSIRFGGKFFITRSISLYLDFEQTDYDGIDDSADRTSLGVAMRF